MSGFGGAIEMPAHAIHPPDPPGHQACPKKRALLLAVVGMFFPVVETFPSIEENVSTVVET
jgi:hypothetical protein